MAKKNETSKAVASKAAKVLKDPKATKDAKSVAASALAQAPDKAEQISVEVPTPKKGKYVPLLGEIDRFAKGSDNFLGEIQSFDPLELICHDVSFNVHRTELLNVNSLEGYVITPVSRTEIYEILY